MIREGDRAGRSTAWRGDERAENRPSPGTSMLGFGRMQSSHLGNRLSQPRTERSLRELLPGIAGSRQSFVGGIAIDLNPSESLTAPGNRGKLEGMLRQLVIRQSRMADCEIEPPSMLLTSRVRDNARPHATRMSTTKPKQELLLVSSYYSS